MLMWECGVPGEPGTLWEGGVYNVTLHFKKNYPLEPPVAVFDPVIFHPNVFEQGQVCLSILDQSKDWRPSISIKDILIGLQLLLDRPNLLSPAQHLSAQMLENDPEGYKRQILRQAKSRTPAAAV